MKTKAAVNESWITKPQPRRIDGQEMFLQKGIVGDFKAHRLAPLMVIRTILNIKTARRRPFNEVAIHMAIVVGDRRSIELRPRVKPIKDGTGTNAMINKPSICRLSLSAASPRSIPPYTAAEAIVHQIPNTNDPITSFLRVEFSFGGAVAQVGHILPPPGKSNAHV